MYSAEAHKLLDEALEILKTKADYPYARLLGMLMPNVGLEDAKRIFQAVQEWEGDK
jgi:hypothetical protein